MDANHSNDIEYQVSWWNDAPSWDRFIQAHSSCVYYRWQFKDLIKNAFGHQTHHLAATDPKGNLAAVLPLTELKSLLFGHFAVSLPYVNYGGVLVDDAHPDAARAILRTVSDWSKRRNIEHTTLRQDRSLNQCDWDLQTHKLAMVLELPDTPDALMKSFKSKLRAQVRRPIKEGAEAKTGGLELLNDFYAVFCRNMRDLGTPVYSRKWFETLLDTAWLSPQLVVVYLNGQPAAAAFLIQHGDTMEIPWASSLREFNRFSVNMLLYWESLCYSIAQGCRFFDFGRSNKESATYRFKKQWGSEEKQLYWYQWTPPGQDAVRLDPNNSKFSLATRMWQRLPLSVANAIGPHLVKNLP